MDERARQAVLAANSGLVARFRPRRVFELFTGLSALPRSSGDTAAVGRFLSAFAARQGLEHAADGVGNVVIRKPAQGCADREGVILQAHQDMVAVKGQSSPHDFTRDPIRFRMLGNGRLGADDTSLGADDGIGMALALALLEDRDILHPPLEAVFTVDEETDMKGARSLDPDMVRGLHLINLDSEDLGLAFTSSAAGRAMRILLPLGRDAPGGKGEAWEVAVEGLAGGHSGVQINEGLGNAYVLLARVLTDPASVPGHRLLSLDQGGARGAENAIPARAVARIRVPAGAGEALRELSELWTRRLRREYRVSDPGVAVSCRPADPDTVMAPLDSRSRDALLRLLRLMPLGVFRFAQDPGLMAGKAYRDILVESSCNLGLVRLDERHAVLELLARGSVESVLDDLNARIHDLAVMAGADCRVGPCTAGWEPPEEKPLVQKLFEEVPGVSWRLVGVHAGLECGCLVESFRKKGRPLHAVSVGPTVRNPHSTQEYLEVESVQPMWDSLVAVLAGLAKATRDPSRDHR